MFSKTMGYFLKMNLYKVRDAIGNKDNNNTGILFNKA